MKKVFRMTALCGLLALAFVSCKKDNGTTGNMTFKATISQPVCDSKTHIGPNNMLVWDAGNTIKVLNSTGQYGDFTTTDNNVVTATFTGALAASDSYTAFYPNAQFDGSNVRLTVSSTQTYVPDNFANNSYPMLAANSGDNFDFHSHAGVLRLQFWSNEAVTVGSVTVHGLGRGMVTGTLVYPFDYHYNPTDVMPYTIEDVHETVTLNCGTGVALQGTPTAFNIILLEGTLMGGFTVTLNAVDGSEIQSFTAPSYANLITAENILIMPALEVTTTGGGGGGDTHAYVDLGLPSGLLWATCNIGANAPEEYGDYFAWGETTPKDSYYFDNYTYSDNPDILPSDHDAATANWGEGWRMPTKAEFEELYNHTTVTWTTQNGVNGRLFTASNGNSLFLPAAGYRYSSNLYYAGASGFYSSSSLHTYYPDSAWYFYFDSGNYSVHYYERGHGQSVRPVCSSRQN